MKRRHMELGIVLLASFILALPVESQVKKCHIADDVSAGLVFELKDWATTADTTRVRLRNTVYKLPTGIDSNAIALVTNERICGKAITGYAAASGGYAPTTLYVIKLGQKGYAVLDPTDNAGDFETVMFFDMKYQRVGGWTG